MNRKITAALAAALIAASIGGAYHLGGRAAAPGKPGKPSQPVASNVQYTCPMHPFIIKEQPGVCAICNMDLVKKTPQAAVEDQQLKHLHHVALSPAQQVMANVATVSVNSLPFSTELRCTGVVAYNQERQGKISAWLAGRLDRL